MNIPEGPVGLPPTYPTSSPEPSGWQRIGQALGRVFSAILSIPQALLSLVKKVAQLASEQIFGSPVQPSPDKISSPITDPVPPNLDELFHETVADNTNKAKSGNSVKKVLIEENEEEISPDSEIDESPQSPIKERQPLGQATIDSEIESLEDIEDNIGEPEEELGTKKSPSLETSSITSVQEKDKVVAEPKAINVPDNGNCLLYAIGIGLRKKYADYPTVQEKLQWDVKPELLTGDLYKAVDLLEAPGKKLREQAATYLEAHQADEDGEVMIALMEGILSHLDVMRKKIEEEEAVIPFLMEDIETLKEQLSKNPHSALLKQQLTQKQEQLKMIQDSVQYQRDNMPEEGELQTYIDITKKDHIYCGLPQVIALSKEYNVPIRVIYNYDKPAHQQNEQLFNDQSYKDPAPPIITIAHVNGNHFQFVDD
jgi:hypothetical protein